MILSLIYQTIVVVLILSFSFGPAFFALINTGIKYGYKTGSLLAIGVVLSDFLLCLLVIFLVNYGASHLIQDEQNQRFMGLMAGLLLIIFAVFYLKRPIVKSEDSIELDKPSQKAMVLKGFFLNSLNPAVWLLWLTNVTAVSKSMNYSVVKMIFYFTFTLSLVLLVELAKVSAAGKLKKVLNDKIMQSINIITGLLLGIFGLVLIYKHFLDLHDERRKRSF